MFVRLDARTLVAGQIQASDMARAKAEGISLIVNNRPEGEAPDQPPGAEIEAAARQAGLDYLFLPVAGLSIELIDAMAEALAGTQGQVLAFCKTGTRSAFLWALAEARRGADGDVLLAQAAAAGYDLSPIAHLLRRG